MSECSLKKIKNEDGYEHVSHYKVQRQRPNKSIEKEERREREREGAHEEVSEDGDLRGRSPCLQIPHSALDSPTPHTQGPSLTLALLLLQGEGVLGGLVDPQG